MEIAVIRNNQPMQIVTEDVVDGIIKDIEREQEEAKKATQDKDNINNTA